MGADGPDRSVFVEKDSYRGSSDLMNIPDNSVGERAVTAGVVAVVSKVKGGSCERHYCCTGSTSATAGLGLGDE